MTTDDNRDAQPTRETDADGRPIFVVPEHNLPRLRERLEKLSRRCAKLGQPAITIREVGRSERKVTDEQNRTLRFIPLVHVTIDGPTPKLAGWTFLCTIDHAGEAGNILRVVPGATVPVQYREAPPTCDHCKTLRRRNDTFIVRHDDGRVAQVGRQCLRDFLGHQSPEAVAAVAEFLALAGDYAEGAEDGGEGGCGSGSGRIPLDTFLAYVSRVIRTDGWVSRTHAQEWGKSATADLALADLDDATDRRRSGLTAKEERTPQPADHARATAAIEWSATLRSRAPESLNDYEHNLKVVTSSASITYRSAGIAASLITTYERALGIAAERRAAAAVSKHVGEVGKRETFAGLTCTKVLHLDTQYGALDINLFRDAAGNVLVWRTGSFDGRIGWTYDLKATVKAHGDYSGVAQTELSRAAVLAEYEPAPATNGETH